MIFTKVLLPVVLVAMLCLQQSEAWDVDWEKVITVAVKCYFGVCFSKGEISELCTGVEKAVIKRNKWGAFAPRQEQPINGIADDVIIQHTGPDTCDMIGLSGSNCQQCLQDQSCVKEALLAMQDHDMGNGLDDIKYNFLIDQAGVIYEGRGWGVVVKADKDKSIVIGMLGDFTRSEPSREALSTLKKVISCGEAAGDLSRGSDLTTGPNISGRGFYQMMQRCHGLCV